MSSKERTTPVGRRAAARPMIAAVMLAALCVALVAGCGGGSSSSGSAGGSETGGRGSETGGGGEEASSGDVVFGLQSPLSKSTAFLGKAYEQGAEVAIEQINAAGGADGKQVSLDSVDDEGQPSAAVPAISKLIDVDKVDAIVGPSSLTVNAVIGKIKKSGIPNIGLAPTDTANGLWGGTAWRIFPSDSLEGVVMSQSALDLGAKEAGTLVEQTAASQSIKDAVKHAFPKLGGEITKEVEIAPGESNYSSQMLELLGEGATPLVFYDMAPETATTMWQNAMQFSSALSGFKVIGSDVVLSEESLESFGEAGEQLELFVVSPSQVGPGAKDYTQAWIKKYGGKTPAEYSAYAYDATVILALAMDKAQSIEHAAVAKEVRAVAAAPGTVCTSYPGCLKLIEAGKDVNYQGASGELEIDEQGEVFDSFSLLRYKDGKTSTVKEYSQEEVAELAEEAEVGVD